MEKQLWFGKYRPLKMLAGNPETEVFLAEHVSLKEPRVIKRVRLSSLQADTIRREAKLMQKLHHPGIPRILDFEEGDGYCCIIEEYAEGETLHSFREKQGGYTLSETLDYAKQLFELIDYLHNCLSGGIMHHDLHPGNLILTKEGLKLIDFGAALQLGETTVTEDSYGTRGFAAPEQLRGGNCDERTDLYAAGRIVQYMLDSVNDTCRNGVGKKLGAIIKRCTEENPARRYRYAKEVLQELSRAERHSREYKQKGIGGAGTAKAVVSVGIIGTHPAAGVTHSCLLLANYLHRTCRKRVAVVELSGHGDLQHFQNNDGNASPCRIHGVDLYPNADSLLAGTLRNGSYDYCIFDLGCQLSKREQELFRCDLKLILTDSAVWHNGREQMLSQLEEKISRWNGWWLLYNHSLPAMLSSRRKSAMQADCMCFSPNPFCITKQTKVLFQKVTGTF